MKKEELLSSDFLKQFKTGDELNKFMHELQKRGVEQLLEGEMDAHLGYEKHQSSSEVNSRNGHTKKRIKTSQGEFEILVPRDRDSTYSPVILTKRKSIFDGI